MNRKFRVKLTCDDLAASYVIEFSENERADQVKVSGDEAAFTRTDGSAINFANVHMDQLAKAVKDQAAECGAESTFEELTGKREFQIRLMGQDFKADFIVSYSDGNPISMVTSSLDDPSLALPNGSPLAFDKVNPTELQSFVSSMAKTNGLNFEFTDLHASP
jgi:hypothetical protein